MRERQRCITALFCLLIIYQHLLYIGFIQIIFATCRLNVGFWKHSALSKIMSAYEEFGDIYADMYSFALANAV